MKPGVEELLEVLSILDLKYLKIFKQGETYELGKISLNGLNYQLSFDCKKQILKIFVVLHGLKSAKKRVTSICISLKDDKLQISCASVLEKFNLKEKLITQDMQTKFEQISKLLNSYSKANITKAYLT